MKLPDEVRIVIKAVVFGTSAEDETAENRIFRAIEHYGSPMLPDILKFSLRPFGLLP